MAGIQIQSGFDSLSVSFSRRLSAGSAEDDEDQGRHAERDEVLPEGEALLNEDEAVQQWDDRHAVLRGRGAVHVLLQREDTAAPCENQGGPAVAGTGGGPCRITSQIVYKMGRAASPTLTGRLLIVDCGLSLHRRGHAWLGGGGREEGSRRAA